MPKNLQTYVGIVEGLVDDRGEQFAVIGLQPNNRTISVPVLELEDLGVKPVKIGTAMRAAVNNETEEGYQSLRILSLIPYIQPAVTDAETGLE